MVDRGGSVMWQQGQVFKLKAKGRDGQLRPYNLAAQNLELVPQHQQLNVLYVQAATAPNKRRQQGPRSEEHTSDLQSRENLVGRLLLAKKKQNEFEPYTAYKKKITVCII